jgi:hypothetical protein
MIERVVKSLGERTGLPRKLRALAAGQDQLAARLEVVSDELAKMGAAVDAQPHYVDQGTQLLLRLAYQDLAARGSRLPFNQVEFRNYSENGEDGILLYVFSILGESTQTCVDIGAATGVSGNCANLIINHGWTGLLIDGNGSYVEYGRSYFTKHPNTRLFPPRFVHSKITSENVNQILRANCVDDEVDLLSLDIDGIDYWVWNAIDAVSPRVVLAEIQAIWMTEASVTVPNNPDFAPQYIDGFGVYSGASLPAFVKLASKKGYRLVGSQRYGFNAVFVRNDVGQDVLPEVAAEACLGHPFVQWAHDVLLPKVKDKSWVAV